MSKPRHHHIDAAGIRLHLVEQGDGPAVLFCHGFPDTWFGWSESMCAVADAGYHAIALDMRGYGDIDVPDAAEAYTAFHTVGDLIAVMDHFGLERAILVGHDFGASTVWNAAMMRPDRVLAVFGVSVPFMQPGGPSFLDQFRATESTDFYMFDRMRPDAEAEWMDAATSIPSSLYWMSGEPPVEERWDPFDRARHALRPIAGAPRTISRDYVTHTVQAFKKTGFHGALNYYRAIDPFLASAGRAFAGATIRQPSFFLTGQDDGLNVVRSVTAESLRGVVPALCGFVELEGVGHWPQLEAPSRFNRALLGFLQRVSPLSKPGRTSAHC
jgi:pimeloyl-ACP methyl ester carboxylesterase